MTTEYMACEVNGCKAEAKWHIRSRKWPEDASLHHNVCNVHLGAISEVLMRDSTTPYDIMLRSQLKTKRRRGRPRKNAGTADG